MNRLPDNAIHRASYYLEELKYGGGLRKVEGLTREQHGAFLEGLLRDAGLETITALEINDACDFYGRSFSESIGGPVLVHKSVWADGLAHGIALAAGLGRPDPPPEPS